MNKTKEYRRIDITNIQNPEFLKDLSYKELDVLSSDITEHLIDVVSKNGGHLSSNLGTVDSTIALCKTFDFKKDRIIFDVGHQCYTYKLLTGRSLERLRQSDGVSGFQKIDESIYDHYECGHSSTSISVANGMSIARDLKGEKYDVIAYIGDGSIVNGLAFEGLNISAQSGHKIIIVLNDNDMSIAKPVGGLASAFRKFSTSLFYKKSKNAFRRMMVSTKVGKKMLSGLAKVKNYFKRKLLNISIFDTLGYSIIGPIDGHNIKAMEKAFKRAKALDKSVVVHIQTIKGKGYKFAENDKTGKWHGVCKFDKETGTLMTCDKNSSWPKIYSDCILKRMKDDEKTVTIIPATEVGSCLDKVIKEFPKRTIDVGIAEEHAVTMAGGLSISGYHPIVSIYSTFFQRSYDQLSHDVARIQLNATLLIDRAGLIGNDGSTHQGIFDEALLYSIPNTVICMASNPRQARGLMAESNNEHGIFCIRYPKDCIDDLEGVEHVAFGDWKIEIDNSKDVALVAVGPEVETLKNLIASEKLDVTLFNAVYQKPVNSYLYDNLLSFKKVIVYQPYATEDGFIKEVLSQLIHRGYKGEIITRCVPTKFIKHSSVLQQKEKYGLTPDDIKKILK